jgi:putative transposase
MTCRILGVSRSGFYAWRHRAQSPREQANQHLWQKIEAVIQRSGSGFGYRQITKQVVDEGVSVSKNRVQRLLQQHQYRAVMTRKYRMIRRGSVLATFPNLLNRQFNPGRPNVAWASDITQIHCQEGWLYLCVVMDLHSRAVIGYSVDRAANTSLVQRALEDAWQTSGLTRLNGLLFHSDRGVQYTSFETQHWLVERGAVISLSRTGNCWDNAVVESFFSLMKQQWLYPIGVVKQKKMRKRINHYIDQVYNHWRIHGTRNQVPMMSYRQAA